MYMYKCKGEGMPDRDLAESLQHAGGGKLGPFLCL